MRVVASVLRQTIVSMCWNPYLFRQCGWLWFCCCFV